MMLKQHPKALYFMWILILLVIPSPLIWLLNNELIESTSQLLVYDAGAVAYVWWLVIVMLSTRPRWLDRMIGLPAMYFVHGMLGILAVIFATIHVQLSFSMHAIIHNTGYVAWYLALFELVYASFFMSGWLVDRFPVALQLKNRLQFFFKHQVSVWIHRLNFVVIGLIWLHVHVIPRISRAEGFLLLLDLYTILAVGLYLWAKLVAPAAKQRKGLVIENRTLDERIRQLKVRFGHDAVPFRAGDFYFLRVPNVKGISHEAHPFSVTTAPGKHRIVTFTIQTAGDFTGSLSKLAAKDVVELEGPFGRFDQTIQMIPVAVPIVLIGLGTGLAPLISLAGKYAYERPVHLLWSVRPQETHIFDDQITPLIRMHLKLTFDTHIHRFTLKDYMELLTDQERVEGYYFVVGTAFGVLNIEKSLRKLGVSRDRLIDERLTM